MTTSSPDPTRDAILTRSQPTTEQARTDRDVARLLDELDTSDAEAWLATERTEKCLLACVAGLLPVREETLLGGSAFLHGRPKAERRQRGLRVLVLHRLLSDPDFEHDGDPYDGREGARVQESRRWQRGLLRFGDGSYERRWYELVREALSILGEGRITPKGIQHAPDFTWLTVHGKPYRFSKGNQAEVIRILFECWGKSGHQDGCGMNEKDLGERVGSSSDNFRVQSTFSGHEVLGTILRRVSKGVYALYLNEA